MTAALAFFFIAVFGDGAWVIHGPFQSYQACHHAANQHVADAAFGAYEYAPMPQTSRCYAQ